MALRGLFLILNRTVFLSPFNQDFKSLSLTSTKQEMENTFLGLVLRLSKTYLNHTKRNRQFCNHAFTLKPRKFPLHSKEAIGLVCLCVC